MVKKENRIVVASKAWYETAPKWLVEEIKKERELSAFFDLMPGSKQEVGDAEACLYLYTASLINPLSYDLTKIYFYIASKLMKSSGIEVPEDIKVEELDDWQKTQMCQLKRDLWWKRGGRIHTPVTDALHEVFKRKRIKKKIVVKVKNEQKTKKSVS